VQVVFALGISALDSLNNAAFSLFLLLLSKIIQMLFLSPSEIVSRKSDFFIVDIREKYEYDFSNIGCINIPMGELCNRIAELPADKIIVLMCKSGKRASALGNLLNIDFGLTNVAVLEGGIEAWREQVEPTLILE